MSQHSRRKRKGKARRAARAVGEEQGARSAAAADEEAARAPCMSNDEVLLSKQDEL